MLLDLKEKDSWKFEADEYKIKAQNSLLLIIGATDISSDYTVSVPGVLKDLDNIKSLFTSPSIGIPEENVLIEINSKKSNILDNFSKEISKKNWDSIILYYGGIGLVNKKKDDLLELVLNDESIDSKKESPSKFDREVELQKITFNADFIKDDSKISIREINQLFKDVSSNVIFLLDCGNSELAFKDFYSQNMFLFSAADGKTKTLDTEDGGIFTMAINSVLEKGLNNNKSKISLQDLYLETRSRMLSNYRIEPKVLSTNLTQYLIITENRFDTTPTIKSKIKQHKPKDFSELKILIGENELKLVFEELRLKFREDNDSLNQVIMQKNRYERITKERNLKMIKEDDYQVEHNQIVYGLLSLMDNN
jgi:hypothetical protein